MGPTPSDTEEAYLLGPISGSSVEVTHHAAIDHWSSPQPVIAQTCSLRSQGAWWIHPQVLQTIDIGDNQTVGIEVSRTFEVGSASSGSDAVWIDSVVLAAHGRSAAGAGPSQVAQSYGAAARADLQQQRQ